MSWPDASSSVGVIGCPLKGQYRREINTTPLLVAGCARIQCAHPAECWRIPLRVTLGRGLPFLRTSYWYRGRQRATPLSHETAPPGLAACGRLKGPSPQCWGLFRKEVGCAATPEDLKGG